MVRRKLFSSSVGRAWSIFLLLALYGAARTATADTINAASCSLAHVQSAIALAQNGDTVTVPAGNCIWTAGLTLSKPNHLQGAGSGRVIGRSTTPTAIGTGTKTFTTQSGLLISAGQALHIERTGGIVSGGTPTGQRGYMDGTVISYSGTTLQMNVTGSSGSGTQSISTNALTTITHSAGSSSLINLDESPDGNVQLSGIRFVTGTASDDYIQINRVGNGKPVLIHDIYCHSTNNFDCIQSNSNRGVIWNASFVALPYSMAQLAIHHINGPPDSWTTPSTMGSADTNGASNLYIEDSDFHGWLNSTDFDNNARGVMRHCLFDNAGFGTHGADTSTYGQRHFEFYDNEMNWNGFSNGETLNLARGFYLRGGTGVIADSIINMPGGSDFPNKLGIDMTVMNLQRNSGPNGCWGANQAGIQYPAPRQVGMGRITGSAGNDSITYKGDSEPLYIWGNTGSFTVGTSDYGGNECTNFDSTPSYVVAGRDYFVGTPKPGYSKYAYPHPLRSGINPIDTLPPSAPTGLIIQ